jgi:hypothetical protein
LAQGENKRESRIGVKKPMLGRAYFGFGQYAPTRLDYDPTLNGVEPNPLESRGGAAQAITTLGLGIQSFLLGPCKPGRTAYRAVENP